MADPVTASASSSRRLDPLGAVALLSYLVIGGVFVFGFAWALRPAIEQQKAAPCKNMRPEARTGAAPDFTVEDLEGNPVSLADLRGKFVVLNFWATWCEPCITEWPQVSLLADRLADRDDVVVVAMSINEDKSDIEPFLQQMSLTGTKVKVLWDPTQSVQKLYGTTQIPDTYFIDESGQLVHAFINVRPWGTPDALQCLDSVAG